jgi:imidazolonepropionase-like amidohydrolase
MLLLLLSLAAQDTLQWRPSWPGTEMAIVKGNPYASEPFVFRFRMPSGYWIHPHSHPVDAHIRVISGTFLVGMGDVLDSAKVRTLAPGKAIDVKTGMHHFEGTRGPTDIEVSGTGPWGITFVDPANAPVPPAPSSPPRAIANVTVIDVRAGVALADQNVIVIGERIAGVGPAGSTPIPTGAQTLDGRGKYLIPGLWDMHVHADSADLATLIRFGITGARDMSGDITALLALRRGITARVLSGPRLVFAGPLLRGPRSASDSEPWVIRTPEQGRRAVDSLTALGADFIKMHEDLSRDAYFAMAAEAKLKGMPFVGHVPAALTPLEASAAGQRSIEHLEFVPDRCMPIFNGQSPPDCSAAGLTGLIASLVANETWLDPTIGSFRAFAPQQFPAILAGFKQLVPVLRAQRADILTGTDLGNTGIIPGESLHDELALLVEAGYTPAEVLRAATLNPATFLGLTGSLGTVERGNFADMVLLDADPLADIRNTRRIAFVFQGGRIVSRGN